MLVSFPCECLFLCLANTIQLVLTNHSHSRGAISPNKTVFLYKTRTTFLLFAFPSSLLTQAYHLLRVGFSPTSFQTAPLAGCRLVLEPILADRSSTEVEIIHFTLTGFSFLFYNQEHSGISSLVTFRFDYSVSSAPPLSLFYQYNNNPFDSSSGI